MEFQKVKSLLDRYYEGATTLEEEARLRRYFSGSNVDERLQEHAPLFQLFALEKERKLDEQRAEEILGKIITSPAKQIRLVPRSLMWLGRVAAILILALGIWWAYQDQYPEEKTAAVDWSKYEITDEQEALQLTRNALLRVSTSLNDGAKAAASELDRMQEMGRFFK